MIVTRQEMMTEAIKLFIKLGYENVSIDMICKHFGVTRGSFYHHFKNKDHLLFSWIDYMIDTQKTMYQEDETKSAANNLRHLVMSYAEFFQYLGHNLVHHTFVAAEIRGKGPLYCLFYDEDITTMTLLIEKAMVDGDIISEFSALELTNVYTDALVGACARWHQDQGRINIVEYISKITACILHV